MNRCTYIVCLVLLSLQSFGEITNRVQNGTLLITNGTVRINGVAVSTNQLTDAQIVALTNGFVTAAITNGLVGTNAWASSNANFQTQINLKLPTTGTNSLASTNFVLAVAGGYVGTNTFAQTNTTLQADIDLKAAAAAVTSSNANFQSQINSKVTTNAYFDALATRSEERRVGKE